MSEAEQIKNAFERNGRAVKLRPSIGQGTAVTKVRVADGLTCEIEDGPWKLIADVGEGLGGKSAGPDPGVYGRAALGSCLAMAYVWWAAKRNVPLLGLEVDVHGDYDARGMLGVDDSVSAGWTGLRYTVTVESDAPKADVLRVLDEADAHSPLLDDFSNAIAVGREVRISAPVKK